MIKGKKGVIQQLQSLIIPLVGIGIVLAVGFLIMAQVKEQAIDMSTTNTVVNSSLTVTFNTTWNVINYTCVHERDISVTQVWSNNSVVGCLIDSGNYTVDGRTINVTSGTSSTVHCNGTSLISPLLITYSCQGHSYAINGTRQVQNATSDIPGWLPIIIITIIGALLIGLVAMFRGRG